MAMGRMLCAAFLACLCAGLVQAQCVSWSWGQGAASPLSASPVPSPAATVSLTVPSGTTLQVALDEEVRVKKVGQPLHGRLVEALYAFDQEVVPVGSEVLGRITEIEGVSGKKRFLAALNVDFTPTRAVQVEFDEIILPEGTHIPIETAVTPGSGRPLRLITTVDNGRKKTAKDAASQKMKEAIQEAKRKWQAAMKQVKEPGKMRRLGRYAVAQLPVHPQYIDAGTVYFAELKEPLDFGRKPLAPPTASSTGNPPPPCTVLAHAQLLTPLSSATAQKDAPVEAVLTQPVFSGERLIFSQGTLVKGTVVQAQPARHLARNGKLRIVFQELVPPGGIEQEVAANLEGVQAGAGQRAKLDLEGGTRSTAPKTRYLTTGLAVALAVMSYEDRDLEDGVTDTRGNASQGAAGAAAGFKLVGIVVGAFVRSRPLALGMGIYGAAMSGYSHFLARGREVVFPKGTAMEIGFRLTRDCRDPAKAE